MRFASYLFFFSLLDMPMMSVYAPPQNNQTNGLPPNINNCGMNNALRQNILDSHNKARNTVAGGLQAGQPGATDMKVLKYNLPLEKLASKYASSCSIYQDPNLSSNGNSPDTYIGQNMFHTWSSQRPSGIAASVATDAVRVWFSEVTQFQTSNINPFWPDYSSIHYTQVVWADTDYVGCGIIQCNDPNPSMVKTPFLTIVVCNYLTSGNLVGPGAKLYNKGNGCTNNCNPYLNWKTNQLWSDQRCRIIPYTQQNRTNSASSNQTAQLKSQPSNIQACGMHSGLRQNIVDGHNQARNIVASGLESGQPGATDMKVMRYSLALEQYASKWASTCPMGHNPNLTAASGNYFGENIYHSWSSQKPSSGINPKVASDAVNAWFSEVTQFSSSNINPFWYEYQSGHYTQVVWADTDQVGCGVMQCLDPRPSMAKIPYHTIVVCNYQTGGNMVGPGAKLYTKGYGCTNNCNSQYSALIGKPTNYGVTNDHGSCGPFVSTY